MFVSQLPMEVVSLITVKCLSVVIGYYYGGNKKGMGDSNFSPIPAFRPSHCPNSRISNAASPRQVVLYVQSAANDRSHWDIIHPRRRFVALSL